MSSRRTGNGEEKVYEAAKFWVERALKADDSLFTPGQAIWTLENLAMLREQFLDRPDIPGDGFYGRLENQLAGSPPETYQLIGEVLYVHFLIIHQSATRSDTKSDGINRVLERSSAATTIPAHLVAGLSPGIVHPGQFFQRRRDLQLGFLIELVERLKEQDAAVRSDILNDPWMFKSFSENLDFRSNLLSGVNAAYGIRAQRDAILHLVFPDSFEGIVSADHKNSIANAFAEYVEQPTDDVDYKLQQIRPHLEARYGGNINLYEPVIRSIWGSSAPGPWDDFVRRAKEYVASGRLRPEESDYKRAIAHRIATARTAVLAPSGDWQNLLKRSIGGNLIFRIQQTRLRDWIDDFPADVLTAIQGIWAAGGSPIQQRIRDFSDQLPRSVVAGPGTRTNVISVLLMGLNVEQYPPFRVGAFNQAYALTGYGRPDSGSNEAALYQYALDFLDTFIGEALARGLEIENRLDAQGIVWGVLAYYDELDDEDDSEREPAIGFAALADELYLPTEFLEEINTMLEDKKQVIFQGPPGTGKTYVARKFAEHISGAKQRVRLVQFHPSYAYEDFVQGFRPSSSDDGQLTYQLREGPLMRSARAAAREAQAEPHAKHFLIIDEINRANLGKVFGELYYLLEYRGEDVEMQYADEGDWFSLPENLYIIGTMNTADRSIALVDLALRRRFYFVEFHPDKDPIKGLLHRYLDDKSPGMAWVADVVDEANKRLSNEPHAAIGPSYFMKPGLNEAAVERIWKYGVLPYIEERLFGQDAARLAEFDLDTLLGKAPSPLPSPSVGE